jgi:hypothetical protein
VEIISVKQNLGSISLGVIFISETKISGKIGTTKREK